MTQKEEDDDRLCEKLWFPVCNRQWLCSSAWSRKAITLWPLSCGFTDKIRKIKDKASKCLFKAQVCTPSCKKALSSVSTLHSSPPDQSSCFTESISCSLLSCFAVLALKALNLNQPRSIYSLWIYTESWNLCTEVKTGKSRKRPF